MNIATNQMGSCLSGELGHRTLVDCRRIWEEVGKPTGLCGNAKGNLGTDDWTARLTLHSVTTRRRMMCRRNPNVGCVFILGFF